MESQNITPQPTKSPTISDSSDRSKFLKSLGFDRMEGSRTQNASLSSRGGGVEINDLEDIATPVREAMVLSSNFEDDLELPGAMNLQEPVRTGFSNSPFADFGNATLEDEVHGESEDVVEADTSHFGEVIEEAVDEPVEVSSKFEPEVSFDIASIDDSVWAAVDHRMRPEPIDLSTTPPRSGVKKKRAHETTVRSAVKEARPPAMPPPLEDDPEPETVVENEVAVVGNDAPEEVALEEKIAIEEPSSERGPLNLNCPSCDRGLTLQPEHLGIPGNCVWCDTAIIAAESGLDHTVNIFRIASDAPASPTPAEVDLEEASPASEREEATAAVQDSSEIAEAKAEPEEDSIPAGESKSAYSPWTDPVNTVDEVAESSALSPSLDSPAATENEVAVPETTSPPVQESTVPTLVAEPPKLTKSSPVVEAEIVDGKEGLPEGEIVADPTAGPSIQVAKLQPAPVVSDESHFEEKSPFPDLSAPLPNSDEFPNAESVVNAEEINEASSSSPFEDLAPPTPFEEPGVDEPFPETDSPFGESAVDKPAPSFLESVATSNGSPFDRPFESEADDQDDLPMPGAFLSAGPTGITASPFDPPVQADGLPEPHSHEPNSEGSSLTGLPWEEVRDSSDLPGPNRGNAPATGLPVADGPRPPMQPIPEPNRKPSVKRSKSRKSRTAVVIAVLGLVSGAGIASFFLPVDDYVVNLKKSWVEWFELKADAGKEWSESAIVPETPAEPFEVEPDPFASHKAPGAE